MVDYEQLLRLLLKISTAIGILREGMQELEKVEEELRKSLVKEVK